MFKSWKQNNKNKTSDIVVIHRYLIIYKNSLITENSYMSNSAETWFGNISDQKYLKKGLGGNLGNIDSAVKHLNKSEKNFKRELNSIKKQKKILYRMAKHTGSRRYLKKINNIRSEVAEKYE